MTRGRKRPGDRIDQVNAALNHDDAQEEHRRIGEAYLRNHPEEQGNRAAERAEVEDE